MMKLKSLLAFFVMGFAVGSVAFVALRKAPEEQAAVTPQTAPVMVYFFDSAVQCETCERIESFAHDVVTTRFGEALTSGKLGWTILDMDAPENTQLVKQFGLFTKSVVLVRYGDDGEILSWENLKDIWELVGDSEAYSSYIEAHLGAFLAEAS